MQYLRDAYGDFAHTHHAPVWSKRFLIACASTAMATLGIASTFSHLGHLASVTMMTDTEVSFVVAPPDEVRAGDTFSVTVQARNRGAVAMDVLQLAIPLPEELTVVADRSDLFEMYRGSLVLKPLKNLIPHQSGYRMLTFVVAEDMPCTEDAHVELRAKIWHAEPEDANSANNLSKRHTVRIVCDGGH